MDDTEITNDEYRQFIQYIEENPDYELSEGATLESLKPDTTVWSSDFTHHYGDPLLAYYWDHPAFDDYPVVGVSWESAREFTRWRSNFLNSYRKEEGLLPFPSFRLPTEAEWEYAARGGRDNVKYPWGNPYTRNSRGCVLANFKPGRGNYVDDGYAYTSPVGVFFPNDFGLYDMSGNVAEWCEDAYIDSYNPLVWDLNPIYRDDENDKKVIRGGSWKDIAFFIEVSTRTFEYKDSTRAFIGFRTAMPHLGRNLEGF
jgi:gliding motility-associated lipoprotein GldK